MQAKVEPILISVAEAAAMLGISRSYFYFLLSSQRIGVIPVRLGKRVLFPVAELENWVRDGCKSRAAWQQIRNEKS